MDKFTLQQEALPVLISYIRKKGFRDPAVIAEILDHFACKVEEKILADPKLSLEEAMEKAHNDFGVAGFRPMAAAYEAMLRKKYKTIYRAELKAIWYNLPQALLILLSGIAIYKGIYWFALHSTIHLLQVNNFAWLLLAGVLAANIYLLWRTGDRAFRHSVLATASANEYHLTIGFFYACLLPSREWHSLWQVQFFATIIAIATIICSSSFLARYRTVCKALAEFKSLEQLPV